MSEAFPPEIRQFVREEIASGKYQSQEELVLDAVRLLRASNLRLGQLREGIKTRLDRLAGGEAIELENEQALGAFLDGIEAEVNAELAAGKKKSE